MRNSNRHISPAHSHVARAAFIAGIGLVSACSGEYPVGEFGTREALLDGDGSTASESPAPAPLDGVVPAALPAADATADFLAAEVAFGTITNVGDLDGDGNEDVTITASSPEESHVLVRYGGPRLTTPESADAFVNTGARLALPSEPFTTLNVAGVGDVDGDGFDDLLVVDSLCAAAEAARGAFLVYGGPARFEGTVALADVSARFAPATSSGQSSGFCQSSPALAAGDLDGDGRADLVLAATPPLDEVGDFVLGQGEGLHVFYGRAERFSGEIPLATADARLEAPIVLDGLIFGDVNGDGRGDFLTGSSYAGAAPDGVIYVPSPAERWSGVVDLQTRAIPLDGALMFTGANAMQLGHYDGDGLADVLLLEEAGLGAPSSEGAVFHLFYGAPGLFDDGVDFGAANARLIAASSVTLLSAGDRDSDGDDEVLDSFLEVDSEPLFANVALVSGTRQRLSGVVTVPELSVVEQTGAAAQLDLFHLPVAADLDGDGASDILTVTTLYDEQGIPAVTRLNFHYGTLASSDIEPAIH